MKRKLLQLSLLLVLGAYVYINDQKLFVETPPVTTKQRAPQKAVKPKAPETKKPTLSGLPALFPSGPMIWIHLKDLGKIVGQIKKSNFYKQAVEYKIYNPSKPFSTNIKSTTKGRSIFSKISSQFEEKALMDFLGQKVGLAFYPPDEAGKSHYFFVAKISAAAKIQENRTSRETI